MNVSFKQIMSDKMIVFGFLVAFLLLLITFVYILFSYSRLPPFIPLFNQMPWGIARLALKKEFFTLPLVALLVLIANIIFSSFLYEKMPLVSRILCITSLLVCLFVTLLAIRTVQLIL